MTDTTQLIAGAQGKATELRATLRVAHECLAEETAKREAAEARLQTYEFLLDRLFHQAPMHDDYVKISGAGFDTFRALADLRYRPIRSLPLDAEQEGG